MLILCLITINTYNAINLKTNSFTRMQIPKNVKNISLMQNKIFKLYIQI